MGAGLFLYRRKRDHRQHFATPHQFPVDALGAAAGAPVIMSSKAQERARLMQQRNLVPAESRSQTPPTVAEHPVSASTPDERVGMSTVPIAFLANMRAEMDHLRRVVEGLGEDRLEPPPEYSSTR